MENDPRAATRRIVGLLAALSAAAACCGCGAFPTGNPERDQAAVVAASRSAAVAKGAAEAAAEQTECADEDAAENDEGCRQTGNRDDPDTPE